MRTLALVLVAQLVTGCLYAPRPPEPPRGDPAAADPLIYRGGWSHRWQRGDRDPAHQEVGRIVRAYPASRSAWKRAMRRLAVTLAPAVAGVGILGVTAGHQIYAEEDRLSARVAASYYVAGGALVVLSLFLDRTLLPPAYRDVASSYNDALRDDQSMR